MGGRASTPLKQFPKANAKQPKVDVSMISPEISDTQASPDVPLEQEGIPNQQTQSVSDPVQADEELEDENEMREYLNALNQMGNSISQERAGHMDMFVPEGVRFVKTFEEEKAFQIQRDVQERQEEKKYSERLGKDKLDEMFLLYKEDPAKWNFTSLAERYSQDPEKIRKTLEYFSPVLLNIHTQEENKHESVKRL